MTALRLGFFQLLLASRAGCGPFYEHPARCLHLPVPGSSMRGGDYPVPGSHEGSHTCLPSHLANSSGPAVAAGLGPFLSPQPQAGKGPAEGS